MHKMARSATMVGASVALSVIVLAQGTPSLRDRAREALARTNGEIALPGLQAPVEIVRDRWGIPHIYARNEHDLFFAQGFVAAQDRLWQLDLWRRIAEGKLSELLGPSGVNRDTFARLLRYRGDWDEEWRSYGPDARAIAQAFVDGINAEVDFVSAHAETLPVEFQLTGTRPGHWTPEVVCGRLAGYVMTRNARTEVQRAQLVQRVGVEKAQELMPTTPATTLTVPEGLDLNDITGGILDLTRGTSESVDLSPLRTLVSSKGSASGAALTRLLSARNPFDPGEWSFAREEGRTPWQTGPRPASASSRPASREGGVEEPPVDMIGSNDWVASGRLTATGKPLLANDPHRALMLPSLRYSVHLNAPGWNVIGAGEPALPGVAAGHNDRIAFGFTIVGIDQQDLYVEQLDPADHNRYLYKGKWEAMRIEHERIAVRGEADREIELRFTRHGPVLHVDETRHRAYALRWVGSEPGTAGYLRSLALDRAQNLDEFRAAVAGWKVPSENIVYADVDGNIAWVAAGLAPVRRTWNGLLPVPGQTGTFEWDGFLPLSALPQLVNPPGGFIGTANHDILPPRYSHELGYEFGAPYRFARIMELLAPAGKPGASSRDPQPKGRLATAADYARAQLDEVSLPARAISRALATAVAERAAGAGVEAGRLPLDPDTLRGAGLLAGWNGSLDSASAAAALYETWSPQITTAFGEQFLPAEDRAGSSGRLPLDRVLALLARAGLWEPEPGFTCWVDGTPRADRTPWQASRGAGPTKESSGVGADPALRARVVEVLTGPSLGQAWRQVAGRQGADPSKWTWGAAHRATFQHGLAFTADMQSLMNLEPVARGGDSTTLNATGSGARQTAGASYREVIDLSNWDASLTINTPGESGQPGSPHYADLLPLWAQGQHHQMAFSREAVERVAAGRLRLVPARRAQ